MALRFRKTIKIATGLKVNVGKKSASVTVGGKGFTATKGTAGSSVSAGVPGSGLSYTKRTGRKSNGTEPGDAPPSRLAVGIAVVVVALILIGIATVAFASGTTGPSCGLYQYRATITEVYDGDTVTADIDLGFNTWRRNEHLRLDGIDTPELRGPRKVEGFAARDALSKRILGRELVICTIKDRQEKFGRYLVKIYDGDVLVNDWLIEAGHGVAYSGGKRQP